MNPLAVILLMCTLVAGGTAAIVLTGNVQTAIDIFIAHGPKILFVIQVLGVFWAGCTGNLKLMAVLLITICGTVWWGW